jgi:PIN domain nuclease of toxin-antitoxin system
LGHAAVILLDTHVLVWLVSEPERLSRRAATVIRKAQFQDGIAIASVTLLELATLFVKGRLRGTGTIDRSIRNAVERAGVVVREITPEIAALAVQFPDSFTRDPADRLIGATARAEGMALVTRDERIRESPLLKTIW